MSVMSQCYSIVIDRGISAPGHGKEVVDGLNAVDKSYISIYFDCSTSWIKNIWFKDSNDVILAKEFQEHQKKNHRKSGAIDQVKSKKRFMERK